MPTYSYSLSFNFYDHLESLLFSHKILIQTVPVPKLSVGMKILPLLFNPVSRVY